MNERHLVIAILLAIAFIGFARLWTKCKALKRKRHFAQEYRDRFRRFADSYRDRFDDELYEWLICGSDRMQSELGIILCASSKLKSHSDCLFSFAPSVPMSLDAHLSPRS